VEALSKTVIADEEQRTSFQLRLNEFLNNKEKIFDQVAERICEAEHKLSVVTKQFEQNNQRYRKFIDRQEQQIIRQAGTLRWCITRCIKISWVSVN
jgi:uncharacterized membrane protein